MLRGQPGDPRCPPSGTDPGAFGLPGSVSPPAPSHHDRRVARAGECPRDRCRRRDPPRREHAAPPPAGARRRRRAARASSRALSDQSLYLRFHGIPPLGPALVEPLLDPDWARARRARRIDSHGTARRSSRSRTTRACATPRLPRSRSPSPTTQQRRGIGTRLLEQLARARARPGSSASSPRCCPRTGRCSRVFEAPASSVDARASRAARSSSASRSRAPSGYRERASPSATTSRSPRRCAPFFEPRTVAVIGASPRAGSIGGELFRNILDADFAGAAYPVNRERRAASPACAASASIAEHPRPGRPGGDLRPGRARARGGRAGARRAASRALCVISAGFAESGAEGAERQDGCSRSCARTARG